MPGKGKMKRREVASPKASFKRLPTVVVKGAQDGTVVAPGPMSSALPGPQAAPATPPPEVVIETAAEIIKAAMAELRSNGTFPPLGGTPISQPLGVGAPPPGSPPAPLG